MPYRTDEQGREWFRPDIDGIGPLGGVEYLISDHAGAASSDAPDVQSGEGGSQPTRPLHPLVIRAGDGASVVVSRTVTPAEALTLIRRQNTEAAIDPRVSDEDALSFFDARFERRNR